MMEVVDDPFPTPVPGDVFALHRYPDVLAFVAKVENSVVKFIMADRDSPPTQWDVLWQSELSKFRLVYQRTKEKWDHTQIKSFL